MAFLEMIGKEMIMRLWKNIVDMSKEPVERITEKREVKRYTRLHQRVLRLQSVEYNKWVTRWTSLAKISFCPIKCDVMLDTK